jgi:hypothetical protein
VVFAVVGFASRAVDFFLVFHLSLWSFDVFIEIFLLQDILFTVGEVEPFVADGFDLVLFVGLAVDEGRAGFSLVVHEGGFVMPVEVIDGCGQHAQLGIFLVFGLSCHEGVEAQGREMWRFKITLFLTHQ